jgi:hypothetical protein
MNATAAADAQCFTSLEGESYRLEEESGDQYTTSHDLTGEIVAAM